MAVHGLERSVSPLHSQQTGPNVKPDENWRRNCLIYKLGKCFPHRPKGIFPLHTCWVCRWECLGCQYANTWLHRLQRRKGTGLAQFSSFSSLSKKNLSLNAAQWSGINHKTPHLCWVGLSLPTSTKGSIFLPSPVFCCCLFLCVVVLSLEHRTKQEGILRQPETSSLLLKGARAFIGTLWVEAMQTIPKGTQAVRNQTSSCDSRRRQTVLGCCLEIVPWESVLFITE